MHTLIHQLFRKRGIDDPNTLTAEERQTYDGWQAVLSKDELTTQDIRDFCGRQVAVIEAKWADLTTEGARKAELIPYHTCYKAILAAIDGPKAAREALEKNLIQLVQQ